MDATSYISEEYWSAHLHTSPPHSSPAFKKIVQEYAKDEALFFKDFAQAYGKLMELGVPFAAGSGGILGFLKK